MFDYVCSSGFILADLSVRLGGKSHINILKHNTPNFWRKGGVIAVSQKAYYLILISKVNEVFFGYFDPVNIIFLNNKNTRTSGQLEQLLC